jgi:hypothetical protein
VDGVEEGRANVRGVARGRERRSIVRIAAER